MFAIEFQTTVKNGEIKIPEAYKDRFTGSVRVILLAQVESATAHLIDELLAAPIQVDNFEPLAREEVYERR